MKEIISTILDSWKSRELPETIARDIDISGYAKMKVRKIVVVTGFRRCGKTYLLLHFIKELLKGSSREKVVYINLEDERIPLKTEFLTELIPTIKQHFRMPDFLFLDEPQSIANWSKWLRRIYDTEQKAMLFVTGSSSKVSSGEIPTELRGRFLEIHVFPLSFKEFLKFKGVDVDLKEAVHSESGRVQILRGLNEYLEYGGLPEVVLSEEGKKEELVQSYYNTVVKMDIIEKFKVRNEEGMKALLRLLLNSTRYSISRLYDTMKSLNYQIGKTTVQEYISYMESSYFMHSLPIFSYNVKAELQYPRKAYFIDNSFITLFSSKFSKNKGRLYENLVFVELKRRSKKFYYWLSRQKEEVDFVILDGLKVKQLMQVSTDMDDLETRKRETKALLKASKELRCSNLIVITEDLDRKERLKGKTIVYRPLWKWLLDL
ncbi:MAG: ATP-binding protein [Candidatus Aenigmarchaeota archaeon]|nr:ATP-binding protein [Candidatus Aenigmarchaeota archaeon]